MSTSSVAQAHQLLARTLNVGLHLGATQDDGWCINVTRAELEAIQAAGFTALRIGVQWAAHCQPDAPYDLDPAVLSKVATVLEGATACGLAVVLSNFSDPGLMEYPARHQARFLAITRQIAAHFQAAPASVLFELMAEPRGKLDAVWNEYLAASLAVAREQNPTRAMIIGPASYNNARNLSRLQLPEDDRHLIVTIHHYWPIKFTMQGEPWLRLPWYMALFLGSPGSWPGTTWNGTSRQQAVLKHIFDAAACWARAHDRPLFVGEFGSSNTADLSSRVRWTRCVRQLCEERGFSWGCWSYGPSFAVYDLKNGRWNKALLDALLADAD